MGLHEHATTEGNFHDRCTMRRFHLIAAAAWTEEQLHQISVSNAEQP
mgnify:CR=1 FL=1